MLLYSSNAVFVKTKALYSRRIRKDDYLKLFLCKDIAQITSFLKSHVNYSKKLLNIDVNTVHRGFLEVIFKKSIFDDLEVLTRYDIAVGEHFFNYMISRIEITNILRFLVFLKSGNCSNYNSLFPDYFLKYTKVNFKKFQKDRNYSDFLSSISGSIYYKIIKKLNYSDISKIDLNLIETLLYSYHFESVIKITTSNLNKKSSDKIVKFYMNYIDIINVSRIIRLKKYYNKDKDYIISLILNFKDYNFDKMKKLILIDDTDEILNNLNFYRYLKKFKNLDSIDQLSNFLKFEWGKRNILFSSVPPIVLLSYIFLKEIEIKNVINIVEGKRYKLEVSEIEKMIIK